jgi:hypothetical protein
LKNSPVISVRTLVVGSRRTAPNGFEKLVGGFFPRVRQIAIGILDWRRDISRQTIEIGFARRMVNDRPITRLRTPFSSPTTPTPTEDTSEKISY